MAGWMMNGHREGIRLDQVRLYIPLLCLSIRSSCFSMLVESRLAE